ncbi:hypothetical protein [Phycicoccus jejuensis]|uniref:hypothetical protein n=1 Tax=Phycicoccus jejuensis TaxID=367299 RepID=UPI0004C32F1E|nr:hypothetical protein [Phycicoccus jejuensis]
MTDQPKLSSCSGEPGTPAVDWANVDPLHRMSPSRVSTETAPASRTLPMSSRGVPTTTVPSPAGASTCPKRSPDSATPATPGVSSVASTAVPGRPPGTGIATTPPPARPFGATAPADDGAETTRASAPR